MKIKVFSFIALVVFGLFAFWQFNDQDNPHLWVSIYTVVALISLLRLFGIHARGFSLLVALALFIYALFFIPGVVEWLQQPGKAEVFGTMTPEKPWIEETREFFGLLLASITMLTHFRLK